MENIEPDSVGINNSSGKYFPTKIIALQINLDNNAKNF
jgi:hypothetical protein